MNRNGGLLAGVLVILTYLGVSNLPKSAESSSAAGPTKSSPLAERTPQSASQPYAACQEIADRLQRFLTKTDKTAAMGNRLGSCYVNPEAPNTLVTREAGPDVRFAIATVPNPVSTHLPLLFDRIVESIQQAAQDELYSYDDAWFPWETSTKDYAYLDDQLKAENLRKVQDGQPGVMVFRQGLANPTDSSPYDSGLIIFLVAETPTGGINDVQFENALAWLRQLRSGVQPLYILGPTFSGSLPSLQLALEPHKEESPVYVWSGTVSSGLYSRWFARRMKDRNDGSDFGSAMADDSVVTDRFCQYLYDQGYQPENIAFLSEDETAFGRTDPQKQADTPCSKALQLSYPRDIATLRSAYEQQSILSPAKPQPNANIPSTTLRGDLSEPSGDHDTVRSYGGQLTPLAQEAVLLDIANRLKERQIQFIVLRSTNSLDQIFLSEFLRRAYAEGRVVIDGADLLFTRGAEGRSLRGVMVLSTYPLLTLEPDWASSPGLPHSKNRTFGEDNAEGTYLAAREVFCQTCAVAAHDDKGPGEPTWLSVIGRRQFWPLAVLNGNVDSTVLKLPTIIWLVVIACAVWGVFHWYWCSGRSIKGSRRARTYFAPISRWQHPALIAFGSLLLAMLAVVIAAASGLLSCIKGTPLYQGHGGIMLAVLGAVIVCSIAACVANYRLPPLPASNSMNDWRVNAGRTAVICLMAFVVGDILLISLLKPANRIPAYWRGINLQSGVSPMLPQILLIAGAYLWFWCTLRGLSYFGDDRPRLPKAEDLRLSNGQPLMPMFSQEEAGEDIERRARPLNRGYLCRVVVCLAIGTGVCIVALQGPWVRTLGERWFGVVIFIFVSLCIAVLVADVIGMWLAWSELRQLLVHLDRLPLRRTLRALKGLAWGSIWKLSGNVLEDRYRVVSLQIESLRHLINTLREWTPEFDETDNQNKMLAQAITCQNRIPQLAEWYANLSENPDLACLCDFQKELATTAGLAMTHILTPAWRKEKESLIFDRSGQERKPDEGGENETAISVAKLEPHIRCAEEFFVLPYLAFIQNILGRLRTMALSSLWLFLAATLAVSSYPFEPLNVLGGIFLGVFVIVVGLAALVYAQMSRDATLSHITDTRPGELGMDFWVRLVTFGVGPLIGLLTTLFPSITDFVFSWLQPSVQALK
ncbi:MAG TPA: hypothetical protein VHY84_02990 [Bryobacteraceae bacterium]|nr:hypothetical protein [Bryobacteraceae bacterium]